MEKENHGMMHGVNVGRKGVSYIVLKDSGTIQWCAERVVNIIQCHS